MSEKKEQRRHERVETHVPIRYYKLRDGAGTYGTGSISRDLSRGGIRFRTPEFVSMACRLILELDIPALSKPIKAISKVAWIKKAGSGKDYEMGNQFLEMSKEDTKLVADYIDNFIPGNVSDVSVDQKETSDEKEETFVSE